MKPIILTFLLTLSTFAAQPPGRWCATTTARANCGWDRHVIQGTNDSWGLGACQSFGITTGTVCDDTNKLSTSFVIITTPYCYTNWVQCGTVDIVCSNGHYNHGDLWMPPNKCWAQIYIISACDALNTCAITPCPQDTLPCLCNQW